MMQIVLQQNLTNESVNISAKRPEKNIENHAPNAQWSCFP